MWQRIKTTFNQYTSHTFARILRDYKSIKKKCIYLFIKDIEECWYFYTLKSANLIGPGRRSRSIHTFVSFGTKEGTAVTAEIRAGHGGQFDHWVNPVLRNASIQPAFDLMAL